MKPLLFYLGLGFICTHELDAVTQHEWRLLYVLRDLPEALARDAFVAVHVPLFAGLVWITHHADARWRAGSRLALMVFLVIHLGLHWRLSTHPLYTFHSTLSWALIIGGAVCGGAYAIAHLRRR
jgi:apolipoprotein N-acyltransferase